MTKEIISERMKMLGRALRYERRIKDLTQKQVADAVGLKENTISAYERGVVQIPIDNLVSICAFIGTDYIKVLYTVESQMKD